MSEQLLANEGFWRVSFFLGVLVLMAAAEALFPRRTRTFSRLFRWSNNLALVVLDSLLLKVCFPVLAMGMALIAIENSWGILNQFETPVGLAFLCSILLLDLAIYAQHIVFHMVPPLWRLHRVHHTDLDFDVTTGIRFHPIEIVLSMAIKLLVILALGPPVLAVLVFEILLNASAMFNHSNLKLPSSLDKLLRGLIVTPDMHRVHHSVLPIETNSNYGFFLPWWDRLFGTYRDQPRDGHEQMAIGLDEFRDRQDMRLDKLLLQPLKNNKTLKESLQ